MAGGLPPQLLLFYVVSTIYVSGVFIIFLLFNLYLLDLGFNEQKIGLISGTLAAGSILGNLPAGWLAQRIGLRNTILACFVGVAATTALRLSAVSLAMQIGSSALSGAVLAMWAVCAPAAVGQLADDRIRPRAFSILFASGIGAGILSGMIGGILPGGLARIWPTASAADLKRAAILLASAVVLGAIVPAVRLRELGARVRRRAIYPRSSVLWRFFAALAVWSLATGAFAPLAGVYFSQHLHLRVEEVGSIFSGSQMSQVAAILVAPIVLRRLGLVKGIASMQIATALSLAVLSTLTSPWQAALMYGVFTAFQWMSEPGFYSLLMDKVKEEEREGASALMALVTSSCQALSVSASGIVVRHCGYALALKAIAGMALTASLVLVWLIQPAAPVGNDLPGPASGAAIISD
ncbi:MAG: MFS transporter [Acidobacteriales bacterium]|nr:MFS transporter [Terriglobales bacterium]